MKKLIQSTIAKIFGLHTQEDVKQAKNYGRSEKEQEDKEKTQQIKILCIEIDIGKPFISVTNEWEDPIIGVVLGVELVTLGNCPIAKVYDFVTNQILYCGNSRIPYSDYNLDAILKLEPYQRWNLVAKSNIDPAKKREDETFSTPEQIKEILNKNSFYKVVKELNALHQTSSKISTEDLTKNVYTIISNNLISLIFENNIKVKLEN